MFVVITEHGQQVKRGKDLKKILTSFYSFQPNDDINTYVYDITKNRSTKIEAYDIRDFLDSMDSFVKSLDWTESYLDDE